MSLETCLEELPSSDKPLVATQLAHLSNLGPEESVLRGALETAHSVGFRLSPLSSSLSGNTPGNTPHSEDLMTAKQQLFVDEYLIDLNATQAAIRAGYSEKTAQAIGAENLTKPIVSEAIAEALKSRSERTEITQDRVLEKLAALA